MLYQNCLLHQEASSPFLIDRICSSVLFTVRVLLDTEEWWLDSYEWALRERKPEANLEERISELGETVIARRREAGEGEAAGGQRGRSGWYRVKGFHTFPAQLSPRTRRGLK